RRTSDAKTDAYSSRKTESIWAERSASSGNRPSVAIDVDFGRGSSVGGMSARADVDWYHAHDRAPTHRGASTAKAKHHVPEGLRSLTSQVVVKGAEAFARFATRAFGAEVQHAMPGPTPGSVMHGHMRVGDSVLFYCDPSGFSGETKANLFVYVA